MSGLDNNKNLNRENYLYKYTYQDIGIIYLIKK